MDMGAKLHGVQQYFDEAGRLVKDVKGDKYQYKTNIPEFVDSIAIPKIQEIMKEYQWKYDTVFYINGQKYQLLKWKTDDGVEVEVDDRILKINKKYFREMYERRDK